MAPPRRLVEAGRGVFLCVLAGQGMLLPQKLYSQRGRGEKACWPGIAPAPEVLFSKGQGAKSLLARERTCLRSSIRKEAGSRKLSSQGEYMFPPVAVGTQNYFLY